MGKVNKNKKVLTAVRLPPMLLDWLKNQEESQAVLIERALVNYYNLKGLCDVRFDK